jgi:hypothetical protein
VPTATTWRSKNDIAGVTALRKVISALEQVSRENPGSGIFARSGKSKSERRKERRRETERERERERERETKRERNSGQAEERL